jgi:hypothetical protein
MGYEIPKRNDSYPELAWASLTRTSRDRDDPAVETDLAVTRCEKSIAPAREQRCTER